MSSETAAGPARPIQRYPSLAAFYNADGRRLRSREHDVGLWWREDQDGPLHRAAWVRDTGELYLVRLGPADAGGGAVELLGVEPDRELLDTALEGWREHCGEPRSLAWLRSRALRFRGRAQATQARVADRGARQRPRTLGLGLG